MGNFKVAVLLLWMGVAALASAHADPVIVRSGAITLKVADFNAARSTVSQIAASAGGQVVSGQDRITEKGKSHGWLRVVVPERELDTAMLKLRTVGALYGDSLSEHNLSQEVKELESRTTRLQQHQQRLSSILQRPKQLRGSDILFFQERLFRAGLDQDLLGHRREQMIGSSNESNISVYLFEPGAIAARPQIPTTFGEKTAFAFASAWKSFSKFMGQVGLFVANLVVYSLVWIPVCLALVFIWRKLKPRLQVFKRPVATSDPVV